MGTQSRRSLSRTLPSGRHRNRRHHAGRRRRGKKPGSLEKKAYSCKPNEDNAAAAPPLFSSAVSYGNLLFLAGVGAHFEGTIEEHTKHVLDELEKNLICAGSSMDKVLKVNVYLNDIKDWARMNTAYAGRWGKVPPGAHHGCACRRHSRQLAG